MTRPSPSGSRTQVLAAVVWALCATCSDLSAQVTLVSDAKALAEIVVADQALPVAQYAAQELQYHIAKATAATLPIVVESRAAGPGRCRVFVGHTQTAANAGIALEGIGPEQSVIRTLRGDLFLVGGDGPGVALSESTPAGTLFAVYELLEQALEVRWLWPGELGEVVPKTDRVVVPATDRTFAPRFFQRQLRHGLSLSRLISEPAYTKEGWAQFKRDLWVWLRRHRMGRSVSLRWGHSFNSFWQLYGQSHPEYFQLLPEHGRGPITPRSRFSMCVSNSELHRLIVARWRKSKASNINLCENDINALCVCRHCRSWDGPDIEAITQRYAYRCVSDRYAQFWRQVHQLASAVDPKVIVTAYAYVNYAPSPQTPIRLNPQIIVGLVPDIFFPRSPAEHEWVLGQWAGWARTGARLFLRPNYFLDGYCMPYIFVHQFAEEYDFDIKHSMAATDFDSLTSQFGTQGTNLYYLARKLVRPDAKVDDILDEYYAGFGPASEAVKAYFDYWEGHVMGNRERFAQISKELDVGWSTFPRKSHLLFPPESFAEGRKRLDRARQAASQDPMALARVEFLQKGLDHADTCASLAAGMARTSTQRVAVPPSRIFANLFRCRKRVERDHIANLNYCVMLEDRAYGQIRQTRYLGEPLRALVKTPADRDDLASIPTRGSHGAVALLAAGEHFRARVRCRRVGRYETVCAWNLFSPDDAEVAAGKVGFGESAEIDVTVDKSGVYNLVVDSRHNVAEVTLLNKHAALFGQSLHLLGQAGPLFVYVPKSAKQFAITMQTPAPGETAQLTVCDAEGRELAKGATGKSKKYEAKFRLTPAQAGRPLAIQIGPAATGVLEDVTLRLPPGVPAYWAAAGDRLLVPAEEF